MKLILIILVVVGGFLGFFHALVAAITFRTCIDVDPDLYMISPAMDLAATALCLAIAWLIGYFQPDAYAFRGIGTRFYGKSPTNRGYIATKWLTAIIPILPIRSYVIHTTLREISGPDVEMQKNLMTP